MLVEAQVVITLEELDLIVASFITSGSQGNKNIHKYIQYVSFAKAYQLPVALWKEYSGQVLHNANHEFNNKSLGLEEIKNDIERITYQLELIYENTVLEAESATASVKAYFEELLEVTLSCLEAYINGSATQAIKTQKRQFVFRPFLLSMINHQMPISSILLKNEFYSKFIIDELAEWGYENEDFFKALFPKLGFTNGLLPWSVFKGLKDEFKATKTDNLYFYITKYFLDQVEDEEVSKYVFTVQEYKDLVKYFLNH